MGDGALMIGADPRSGRKNLPANDETLWMVGGVVLSLVIVGVMLWTLGAIIDPGVEQASNNPIQLLVDQARGYVPVGGMQLTVFALGMLLLLALTLMLVVVYRRSNKHRSRVDHLAKGMAHAKDFAELGEAAATADTERLGAEKAGIGVPPGSVGQQRETALRLLGMGANLVDGAARRKDNLRMHPADPRNERPCPGNLKQTRHCGHDPWPSCSRGHGLGSRCPGDYR